MNGGDVPCTPEEVRDETIGPDESNSGGDVSVYTNNRGEGGENMRNDVTECHDERVQTQEDGWDDEHGPMLNADDVVNMTAEVCSRRLETQKKVYHEMEAK